MSAAVSSEPERLDGQTALITVATSGLGRAIAQRLAQDGFLVMVHGRDPERGAEVVRSIEAAGGKAHSAAADLGSDTEVLQLAKDVGDVDVLVNNAGFVAFAPTADLPVETFDATFAINVRAPFYLVAAFAPEMVKRGHGSIISVDSMAGAVGLAGGAAYGASNAALSAMTRVDRGVQLGRCARQRDRSRTDLHRRRFAGSDPSARRSDAAPSCGEPDETAGVVAFLASPLASYITCATIAVDGGRTAV